MARVRLVVSLVIFIITGCDSPKDYGVADPGVSIKRVTDIGVVPQDHRLLGRDGGYSGVHAGEVIWVFGDTVITEPNATGQTWLSNSYSTSVDRVASDGLDVLPLAGDEIDSPIELFNFTVQEASFNDLHSGEDCVEPCGARWALWPGPIVADTERSRSLVMYGKISSEPGELNFYGVGQSIAIWNNDEVQPTRQTVNEVPEHPTLLFGQDEPQFGPGAMAFEDSLYVFACDRQEFVKPCKLARAPLATVLDKSSWQYFSRSQDWTESVSGISELFHGNDIMSVSFNAYLNKFMAVYSEPLSRNIQLRTANSPEGPWSTPVQVAQALPSGNTNGWVYDALAHAEFSELDGQIIYVTYTRDTESANREMRLLEVELELDN